MIAPSPNEVVVAAGPVVVAVDIGGTFLKVGSVDRTGELSGLTREPTRRERGPDAVIETILDVTQARVAHVTAQTGVAPVAVGVAVPGHIDDRNGIALFSENLGWRDVPLRALLAERLDLPVAMTHDVRAGAFAEARLGAGAGAPTLLFVAIGTGIGGAIAVDGHVISGASNLAGELGHVPVRQGDQRCGCGSIGCLETMFSAAALQRRYLAVSGRAVTAAQVAELAATGDPAATVIWREGIDALAEVLTAAVLILDPDRIVIGGGLAQAGRLLFEPLVAELAGRRSFAGLPTVLPAMMSADAGAVGAGLYAWDLVG